MVADPLAALAVIWWIREEAREALEAARAGRRDEDWLVPGMSGTMQGAHAGQRLSLS
jgi:hypothetical protein